MAVLKSEQDNPNLVILSGYIDVESAEIDNIKAVLPMHISATRAERGCQRFDIWQDAAQANIFHVFEVFDSHEAFKAHQARAQKSKWVNVSKNAVRHYDIEGL